MSCLGPEAVGAFVIGATLSAVPLALFMNTGGGAWDNAKKFIETGKYGGKGSPSTRSSSSRRHSRRPIKRHSRTKPSRTHKTAQHTINRLHPAVHKPATPHLSNKTREVFSSQTFFFPKTKLF